MANKDIEVRKENQPRSSLDLMPEFDEMVQRFFGPRFRSLLGDWPAMGSQRALTNVRENENAFILTAEIPGVPREDIQIQVNGNLLTIRAEHKEESGNTESERGFRRQYRSFNESFSLPSSIDADKIDAHYENGVLEVMLPKMAQAQPKKIEIRSGSLGTSNQSSSQSPNRQTATDVKH